MTINKLHESSLNERTATRRLCFACLKFDMHDITNSHISRAPSSSNWEFRERARTALIRGGSKGPRYVTPLLSPQPRLLSSAISLYETRQQRIRLFLYCRDYYPPPTLSFRNLMRHNCAPLRDPHPEECARSERVATTTFKRTVYKCEKKIISKGTLKWNSEPRSSLPSQFLCLKPALSALQSLPCAKKLPSYFHDWILIPLSQSILRLTRSKSFNKKTIANNAKLAVSSCCHFIRAANWTWSSSLESS